jgi:hypothetical protein
MAAGLVSIVRNTLALESPGAMLSLPRRLIALRGPAPARAIPAQLSVTCAAILKDLQTACPYANRVVPVPKISIGPFYGI